jgi:hypothetical protein
MRSAGFAKTVCWLERGHRMMARLTLRCASRYDSHMNDDSHMNNSITSVMRLLHE